MIRMQPVLYHLARLILAMVFVYAGAVKMQDVVAFAGHVAAYQILPYAANYLVASTLPYVEFLAGVMLLLNLRVRPALMTVGAMTVVFMVALVSVLLRGLEIDCGCFNPGGGQETTAGVALLRDIALLVLIIVAWWLRSRITALDSGRGTRNVESHR